jgi:hypothetical protein
MSGAKSAYTASCTVQQSPASAPVKSNCELTSEETMSDTENQNRAGANSPLHLHRVPIKP